MRSGTSPLKGFGQRFLQVCGGSRERELDCDAATVVENGGEVVSFRWSQDSQLVVGLTWNNTKTWRRLQQIFSISHYFRQQGWCGSCLSSTVDDTIYYISTWLPSYLLSHCISIKVISRLPFPGGLSSRPTLSELLGSLCFSQHSALNSQLACSLSVLHVFIYYLGQK